MACMNSSFENIIYYYLIYDNTYLSFEHRCTVMRIIKLKLFPVPVRLHSGYGKLIFVIISPFVAISKNVVRSLEPGETPSYSASHLAPNYAQR